MKTKSFLLGITFFAMGVLVTFGMGANSRHHNLNHHAGIRKAAIIEVGAPLTVSQLKHLNLI